MKKQIRVAVCGELPTACDYLLQYGVMQIDQYPDATEIANESSYHLILIYAPNYVKNCIKHITEGPYEKQLEENDKHYSFLMHDRLFTACRHIG